jgi:hypothetical protein
MQVRKLDAALVGTGSSFLLVCVGGFDHQEKTKPAGRLVGVQALLNRVTTPRPKMNRLLSHLPLISWNT